MPTINRRLKHTFLAHSILMAAFGLTFLVVPVWWGNLTGCLSNIVPQSFRALSVGILALAIGSLLAYREDLWERVQLWTQVACITNLLWPAVILLGLIFWDLPRIAWMYLVVLSGLGAAFNLNYPRQ